MGFSLCLDVRALINIDNILNYNMDYQKDQSYFKSDRWSLFKRNYLNLITSGAFLKTLTIKIDEDGIMGVGYYQIPEEFKAQSIPEDFNNYILPLWIKSCLNDAIKVDNIIDLKDDKVEISLYHGSSYKGDGDLDIDFGDIHRHIEQLEENFINVDIVSRLMIC